MRMATASTLLSYPRSGCREFAARTVLDASRHYLWQIEAGFVRTLTWAEDGTVIVLGIWGPGDMVGRSLSKLDLYQIECLTKVEATLVPQETLASLADILLTHLHYSEELSLIRGAKRVDIMLLKMLAWLADRFGRVVNKGRLIDLRLTHQDLADLLGTTRVTITRVLSQLEQQGYIQRLPLQQIVLQQDTIWHYEI